MQKDTGKRIERMKALIAQIKEADTAYFKYDNPKLTDRVYDELVDELKALERMTGIVMSNSPTSKVSGGMRPFLKSVRHTKPMLSADKTKSVADLVQFAKGRAVLLSWKLDGLTLVLRYEKGSLKQAITRGRDGINGEDVTHTVRHFLNVPLIVPEKAAFEVRGEGVISWDNFEKLNSGMVEPYRHPRSVAAGSVRKLDSDEASKRKLEFVAFDLIDKENIPNDKRMHFAFLSSLGFDVVSHRYVSSEAGERDINLAIGMFEPAKYKYPVDGIIMEYADTAYGKSLGETGHHENRLIALKWQDDLYETKFIGIEPAVTKNGMISLTGLFEPVEIDGSTVSRAYLHNVDIVNDLKLGRGDTIMVYKANMIIPQIADNKTKSGALKLPSHCPSCGSRLVLKETEGGTKQLYCENQSCPAKLVRKFVHFCDKTRMNIEGLSEKTLTILIGKGFVRTFGDLYDLEHYRQEIICSEGYGEQSFERMQEAIDRSRVCTLDNFIAAMGIHTVGRTAGKVISRYFSGDFDKLEQALKDNFDFTVLPGIGSIMNENLHKWYADEEEAKLWHPLLNKIIFVKENRIMVTKESTFTGKTVVATGKLQNYTRTGINDKIISLGGKAGSTVTKNTDYLIVGEKAGSKLSKAKELGVTILSEAEFERMIA